MMQQNCICYYRNCYYLNYPADLEQIKIIDCIKTLARLLINYSPVEDNKILMYNVILHLCVFCYKLRGLAVTQCYSSAVSLWWERGSVAIATGRTQGRHKNRIPNELNKKLIDKGATDKRIVDIK
jgi:hypothetical protein